MPCLSSLATSVLPSFLTNVSLSFHISWLQAIDSKSLEQGIVQCDCENVISSTNIEDEMKDDDPLTR